jgi:hypothetical protein
MQNILKMIIKTSIHAITVGFVGYGAFLLGQHDQSSEVNHLLDLLVEESRSVSPFEYEAVKLAEALDGEARGHRDDWSHIVTAVFNRTADSRWADTPLGVLLDGEIDALFDQYPEDLSTEGGQAALAYAAAMLVSHEDGDFVPLHTAHSWATPAAADGHAYFEGLDQIAAGSGHQYFTDKSVAPAVSLRPQARPADPILLALLEAQK